MQEEKKVESEGGEKEEVEIEKERAGCVTEGKEGEKEREKK